jgi:hypothetical protein
LAINCGLNAHEFWFEEPYLLVVYAKANEIKIKNSLKEWQEKENFKAWLNGAYIRIAVNSALSKNGKYPENPFELFKEENLNYSVNKNEELIRNQAIKIDEILKSRASRKP